MDNHEFVIIQGSTPRIEMALPFEFPDNGVAFATFAQKNKAVLEYGLHGTATPEIVGSGSLALDAEDSSMLVLTMTQADTLGLTPGDAELQLRIKTTDGADTFFPLVGAVVRAWKTGVIS